MNRRIDAAFTVAAVSCNQVSFETLNSAREAFMRTQVHQSVFLVNCISYHALTLLLLQCFDAHLQIAAAVGAVKMKSLSVLLMTSAPAVGSISACAAAASSYW